MQQDKNVNYKKRDNSELGDFGQETPANSFSGGETDHLFISDHGEQFYDLDKLSGLADPGDGRSFSILDYDRDGFADFVTASASAPTFQLYRNRLGETHRADLKGAGMVALRFRGGNRAATPSDEWSNRDGYGVSVTVFAEGPPLKRELRCGEGRATQNSTTMLVGIGATEGAERIEITWPSGRTQSIEDVPVGSLVTFFENPQDNPDGEVATVEPYLLRVLSGARIASGSGKRMPMSLPVSDTPRRLNLITAMTTHCATCKRKQPQVKHLRESFSADEVGIWGVSTDLEEDAAALSAYENEHEVYYDVLPDIPMAEREALKQHIFELYSDDLTPVTVITDPTGRILSTVAGIPSVSDVAQLLAGTH